MNDKINIDEVVNRLQKSFVFKASLGSKELFHSNIWAWILENEDIKKRELLFNLFFPNVEYKDMSVWREWNHLDLSIWTKDNKNTYLAYVIENKMKSIPYISQLQDYKKIFDKHKNYNFVKGVLTGMEEPTWMSEAVGWRFVSYKDICKTISDIASYNSGNIKVFLDGYANMLEDIYYLLEYYDELYNKQLPLWKEESKKASNIKLWDLVQKREADKFKQLITKDKRYTELKNKCNGDLKLSNWLGYNNGKFTLDIRISCENPEYRSIGIQIEAYQYRRTVQEGYSLTKEETSTINKKTFEKYKKIGWFRDSNEGDINYHGYNMKSSNRKREFCKYNSLNKDNKIYSFVYQYVKLETIDNKSSYDFISELLFKDLEIAYSIFAENN